MLLLKKPKSVIVILSILLAILALLFAGRFIRINTPSNRDYPVRGIDVSAHQGRIDWQTLAGQDIAFAFIKATEGSGFVDRHYYENIERALQTDLRIGSYHFFRFESPGLSQAQHFISVVKAHENMLPPVVDLEFYGEFFSSPPEKNYVERELAAMLETLESHYGMKPIIYVTSRAYKAYIEGGFADYDIWIRDVFFKPRLEENRPWTFWQYTDRAELNGYDGDERFIDLNVFNGGREEFYQYGVKANLVKQQE